MKPSSLSVPTRFFQREGGFFRRNVIERYSRPDRVEVGCGQGIRQNVTVLERNVIIFFDCYLEH